MTVQSFLNGSVVLHGGDCLEVMASLPENSVDAIVCDPPYHLTTGKKGGTGVASLNVNSPAGRSRISTGFMGKAWDGGDIAFQVETWAHCLRILRPGGHLVAFSGTRTYHRMACAIEDAGFEVRDMICWHYGSGFPKSLNVSKGMDKKAGVERADLGVNPSMVGRTKDKRGGRLIGQGDADMELVCRITAPATDAAKQWDGYGTALKPATEPICLARKPLIGTVVENVLTHGTGALNVDGCRIEGTPEPTRFDPARHAHEGYRMTATGGDCADRAVGLGRWPANLIHDGSPEVRALFPDSGPPCGSAKQHESQGSIAGSPLAKAGSNASYVGDTGSAARFFYTAKADSTDRLGSKHPTVKPLDLMQWLVRLVCPKGGVVLDPFAGTGSTGEAAWREGMSAILIEREPEYQADIARRMELAVNPTKRAAVAKTKNNLDRPEDLPLFSMGNGAE
jgi:DNA modification methylase